MMRIMARRTKAAMRFSDLLIDAGAEFSMMPASPGERHFVPPFAKINLIDDVQLQLSAELVEAVDRSRPRALNVMTAEPESIHQLRGVIKFDDVIEIRTLSNEERSALISEWQKANRVDRGIG
jgi:hypothetical protein